MKSGYTDLPPGKIAAVVTYLEMRSPPRFPAASKGREFTVRRVADPDLDWYRKLYREIGEPWLWFSRLRLSDDELRHIVHDPAVDVFALAQQGRDGGLLELDRRRMRAIEVSFFGVIPSLIGRGAGRALLEYCLPLAWNYHPERVWLHTCTLDHPEALNFYLNAGFIPYERAIEVADDPRLTGDLAREAARHVPIL